MADQKQEEKKQEPKKGMPVYKSRREREQKEALRRMGTKTQKESEKEGRS